MESTRVTGRDSAVARKVFGELDKKDSGARA